eukprot:49763-Amphidinium_carterae.1
MGILGTATTSDLKSCELTSVVDCGLSVLVAQLATIDGLQVVNGGVSNGGAVFFRKKFCLFG